MKLLTILIIFLSGLLLAQDTLTPVQTHGQLSVDGSAIVDSSGEPVALAGNSFFWSNHGWGGEAFYTQSVVEHLKNDWNASIVRAAMGVDETGGYLSSPESNLNKVRTIIDAAIELGLYVIVDWHSHHAELYETDAVNFFTLIANEYGEHPNIIYEIYNEPLAVSWSNVIKPYAETVISAIRAVDEDNLIVVGTPNWSQDVDAAAADPIDTADNIAYTIHFYAGTHRDGLRSKAQTAIDAGIALFCTEWGAVSADGDGAVDEVETLKWMEFMRENFISHCNWAVNNKAEGSSAFIASTSPTATLGDEHLTASGTLVKGIIQNWGIDYQSEAEWTAHYQTNTGGDIIIGFSEIENWNGGFNGNITITNNGSAVNNYTLGFTAPWTITSIWHLTSFDNDAGTYSVPVIDHEWLSQINTGQSATIGFTADGSFSIPTNVLWNGAALVEEVDPELTSYTDWQATHAVGNSELDDDLDGYQNLIEFLMGTDPSDSGNNPTLMSSIEGGYLKVQFPVNPKALKVEYRLEVSDDLESWFAVTGDEGMSLDRTIENADTMMNVEWISSSPISTLGERFFTRLEVREVE